MIFVWGGLLIVFVLGVFALPFMRRPRGAVSRIESANAMLQDQLAEIERDIARGLISVEDGKAATIEVKRRIIALAGDHDVAMTSTEWGRLVVAGAGILVSTSAVALYFTIGSPEVPSISFAQQSEARANVSEQTALTQQLRMRLEAEDNGGPTEGWLLLADAYMSMEQFGDAADAYSRVLEREEATVAEFTRFAEALILRDSGQVTPLAERALDRALQMSPNDPAALYYKSFALEQAGRTDAAYSVLVARLDAADGFYPWMEAFVAQANFYGSELGRPVISLTDFAPVARGPDAEDIANAADLSEEDRDAFIKSMVQQLASRLEQEPDDLDGWLQLARAYSVLRDAAGEQEAYQNAGRFITDLPQDDPRRVLVETNLAGNGG
jgi:cytochrome c-type biogenesis protein CcmH